jgi:transposase
LAAFGPSGGGAAEGRALPETVETRKHTVTLLADRAYEEGAAPTYGAGVGVYSGGTAETTFRTEVYKRRKEAGRFFRRPKAFRGIRVRYDKPARILFRFHLSRLYLYRFTFCEHALVKRLMKRWKFWVNAALHNFDE